MRNDAAKSVSLLPFLASLSLVCNVAVRKQRVRGARGRENREKRKENRCESLDMHVAREEETHDYAVIRGR